jgi:phosphoglycerate dehydrogenase-like enzyme
MFSAGTDEPVFGELRAKGVKVTNSVGAAARSIAHSVIMQVLALSRHARPWALDQAAKRWQPRHHPDIEGRTMAIVGLGSIGGEVARIAPAFGMRVIGVRRHRAATAMRDLADLAPARTAADGRRPRARAAQRRCAASSAQPSWLRPSAHVVNVGRAQVLDEPRSSPRCSPARWAAPRSTCSR